MKKSVPRAMSFVILDHDKQEFCIKSPMLAETVPLWQSVIDAARELGRNVVCYTNFKNRDGIAARLNGRLGYAELASFDLPKSD